MPQQIALPNNTRRCSYGLEQSLTSHESVAAAASKIDQKPVKVALPQPIEDFNDLKKTQERKLCQITKNLHDSIDSKDSNDSAKEACLHVLIVEDNLVNQKVLCKQLTKASCIVSTADNGVWALKHLEKTKFRSANGIPLTIILMDCEMPEMDGLTCCRKIREMERSGDLTKHVFIIAVTANIRGGQIDTAKEAGIDEIVRKPFRIPDLLVQMRGLLERLGG